MPLNDNFRCLRTKTRILENLLFLGVLPPIRTPPEFWGGSCTPGPPRLTLPGVLPHPRIPPG